MSEKKDTFTLFGVELGTCKSIENGYLEAIQYYDFEANEIGKSLGLIDSWILNLDLYSGEISSYAGDNKPPIKLNHKISLGMNVPVIGEVGE